MPHHTLDAMKHKWQIYNFFLNFLCGQWSSECKAQVPLCDVQLVGEGYLSPSLTMPGAGKACWCCHWSGDCFPCCQPHTLERPGHFSLLTTLWSVLHYGAWRGSWSRKKVGGIVPKLLLWIWLVTFWYDILFLCHAYVNIYNEIELKHKMYYKTLYT